VDQEYAQLICVSQLVEALQTLPTNAIALWELTVLQDIAQAAILANLIALLISLLELPMLKDASVKPTVIVCQTIVLHLILVSHLVMQLNPLVHLIMRDAIANKTLTATAIIALLTICVNLDVMKLNLPVPHMSLDAIVKQPQIVDQVFAQLTCVFQAAVAPQILQMLVIVQLGLIVLQLIALVQTYVSLLAMNHNQLEHLTMKLVIVSRIQIVNHNIVQHQICVNQAVMKHNPLALHMWKIVIVKQLVIVLVATALLHQHVYHLAVRPKLPLITTVAIVSPHQNAPQQYALPTLVSQPVEDPPT
jgi:hypothetical protein